MDAKLVYRLCQLSEIKIKNAYDQTVTCAIDLQTGKWTVTEPKRKKKPAAPLPYPMVSGRIVKHRVLPAMIIHDQSRPVNPKQVVWMSFESETQ